MIESMTGYGSARARLAGNTVEVFLHSVNNKSFKLTVRLPEAMMNIQQEIEELKALAKKSGLSTNLNIEHVVLLPGALREKGMPSRKTYDLVLKTASKALDSLVACRRREGRKIGLEVRRLLVRVAGLCRKVQRQCNVSARETRNRVSARLKELLDDVQAKVKQEDIVREAAIIAERSDVTEELHRLLAHTQEAFRVLNAKDPAGRRLEFTTQEMLREANTMSAKSGSTLPVAVLLELKENIDRIREQAQNVQ
jgi:uncharacterized protein (TIGR00255 family)